VRVHKVHFIGSQDASGWQSTACGIYAMRTGVSDEYETEDNRRIEARYHEWKGVTCGRCLRNAHRRVTLREQTASE
jgi:hypothetical protein